MPETLNKTPLAPTVSTPEIPLPPVAGEVKAAIQEVLEKGIDFDGSLKIKESALNQERLELASSWCYKNFHRSYNAETIARLYNLIERTVEAGLSAGPVSYRYCRSVEEAEAQFQRVIALLGDNLDEFASYQKILLKNIGDYQVMLHKHPCEWGAGLLCVSMWRDEHKVFQVSFYPSNPAMIYEIKGGAPTGDADQDRARKKAYHRFTGKYGITPPSALVIECLKLTQEMNTDVEVISQVSLWRNHAVGNNARRHEQANKVYEKVHNELDLHYEGPDLAITETVKKLEEILGKKAKDLYEAWRQYRRSLNTIKWAAEEHEALFDQGKKEFITKVIYSDYADRLNKCISMIHGQFGENREQWMSVVKAVSETLYTEFNLPMVKYGTRDEEQEWFSYRPALFKVVTKEKIDELSKRFPLSE